MMEVEFLKLVCIDESDPLEYKILEDINRRTLQEIHEFVSSHYEKHKGAKWILLPYCCKVNNIM